MNVRQRVIVARGPRPVRRALVEVSQRRQMDPVEVVREGLVEVLVVDLVGDRYVLVVGWTQPTL